jgi:protein-L-isoaspartate(D-aspartate) O-methyltransferase
MTLDTAAARETMVRRHLAARGIRERAVLAAMGSVPREAFLPPEMAEFAYEDAPLPIAQGQTISQPYIVALMTEALALRPEDRVLEIGTGSGYAAAILGRVAREVYTIERHGELADTAAGRLRELGFRNVHVLHGDGTLGWAEHAPYDAIVVAAGGPDVPDALVGQLAVGGRLVIPLGADRDLQTLVRITRGADGRLHEEDLGGVRVVPDGARAQQAGGQHQPAALLAGPELDPGGVDLSVRGHPHPRRGCVRCRRRASGRVAPWGRGRRGRGDRRDAWRAWPAPSGAARPPTRRPCGTGR